MNVLFTDHSHSGRSLDRSLYNSLFRSPDSFRAIETHFRARLDPTHENRWFAMEAEWKLVGPQRRLVVKQARPYSFGSLPIPPDCREK